MKELIESGDLPAIKNHLEENPAAANTVIHFGHYSDQAVAPIHYACDCVFEERIREEQALKIVQELVRHGAHINGTKGTSPDPPLIAAISLLCEKIAIWLLERGADPHARGTHRGTALHWAAYVGADQVVPYLLGRDFDLEDREDEFGATPLIWAVNGAHNTRTRGQVKVVQLLLEAGANPRTRDIEGNYPVDLVDEDRFPELYTMLRKP